MKTKNTKTTPARNALLMTALFMSVVVAVPTAVAEDPERFLIQAPYDGAEGAAIAATGSMVAAAATTCRYPERWCYAEGSAAIVALKTLNGSAAEIGVTAVVSAGPSGCIGYCWSSAWAFLVVSHELCAQCSGGSSVTVPSAGGDILVTARIVNLAGGPIPEGTLRIRAGIALSLYVENPGAGNDCGTRPPFYPDPCLTEATSGTATIQAQLQKIEGTVSSAAPVRSIEINPPSQRQSIAPSQTAVYDLTVSNTGTGGESITLTTSGERNGWTVSLSRTSLALQPGQSEVVQLSVTGSKGNLEVTITAAASGDVGASASTTTTVRK